MIRRDALREYTSGSLWLLPTISVVVALLLGSLLSRVSVGPGSLLAFQGTADDARALLIGITGTMVTVIALLLGLAVVALQLATTQFSPRLLRNFLRDRPNQIVLSVFVGTFAYAAGGLFEVGVSGGQPGKGRLRPVAERPASVVHLKRLLAAAADRRLNIRIRPRVGEHITAGMPLAWIWPTSPEAATPAAESFAGELDAAVRIGFERTLEQDPGLGLRQLVDPACKALSPAVNDPYTAIQAIEHLEVLFAALAARPVGPLVIRDAVSGATVAVPARSFAEHLALGVGLIRRFGSNEPTVAQALFRLLYTVLHACGDDPERCSAIQGEADLLITAVEREALDPADLAIVSAEANALRQALPTRRSAASSRSPAETEQLSAAPSPT